VEDDDPNYEDVPWLQCRCVHCGPTDAHGQQRCTIYLISVIAIVLTSQLCEECRNDHAEADRCQHVTPANM